MNDELEPEHVTYDEINQWSIACSELKVLKAKESALRKKIILDLFPMPKEGTNIYPLPAGYKLKMTSKLDRKVEEASVNAVLEKIPEHYRDRLVKYTPSLVLKEYRLMNEEDQKIFDHALDIKPASPSLELVAPKEKPKA